MHSIHKFEKEIRFPSGFHSFPSSSPSNTHLLKHSMLRFLSMYMVIPMSQEHLRQVSRLRLTARISRKVSLLLIWFSMAERLKESLSLMEKYLKLGISSIRTAELLDMRQHLQHFLIQMEILIMSISSTKTLQFKLRRGTWLKAKQ